MHSLQSTPQPLQGAFRALADPTRRDILTMLAERDMSVAEVAARFDMTRAAVRKHLNVLEEGALVSIHRRGRESVSQLEPMALKAATDWLNGFSAFWDARLGALHAAIDAETSAERTEDHE